MAMLVPVLHTVKYGSVCLGKRVVVGGEMGGGTWEVRGGRLVAGRVVQLTVGVGGRGIKSGLCKSVEVRVVLLACTVATGCLRAKQCRSVLCVTSDNCDLGK